MHKISVAMTTYNGERFLAEQLGSILTQSRPVDELVVCDDGSTDGTFAILKDFSKRVPFPVRIVINEKNLGYTKNFEKVMSLCEGDIIILCDQDDTWLPNKVAILEEIFLTNPTCGMAFTNAMIVDVNNRPIEELWPKFDFGGKRQKQLKNGNGLGMFVRGNVVTGATAAVSKVFFEEVAPFPVEIVHDYWLAIVAVLKEKLFFNNVVTTNYRRHSAQQLGVPHISISQKINEVVDYDRLIYLTQMMLNELDERFCLTEKQRRMFMGKINFYTFRKDLPSVSLMRVPGIINHMLTGGYCRYATGILSAFKDLIRK